MQTFVTIYYLTFSTRHKRNVCIASSCQGLHYRDQEMTGTLLDLQYDEKMIMMVQICSKQISFHYFDNKQQAQFLGVMSESEGCEGYFVTID